MPDIPPALGELGHWAQEYAEDLRRFLAKRRLIEADIKDVCQEVYLRLLRFERQEVVENPRAYLLRVAANVAHDFKLKQQRWEPLTEERLADLLEDAGPEEAAESADRHAHLAHSLGALPPLMRAALALQASEGLTYERIAERLGVSRRAVKRAIARGLELLREQQRGDR